MKTILQQIDWQDVGQIVLQGVITVAVLTYVAGWCLGRWLHRANDQLARAWVTVTVTADLLHLEQVASDVHVNTPTAPLQHPLAMAAQGLAATHTAAELRLLVGTRAKLPKHRLAGMAVALAC